MAWSILGLCLLMPLAGAAQGLQLWIRRSSVPISNHPRGFVSRAAGSLSLNNSADISYYANITLGNQNFKVLIDTGSSDLWVAGTVVESNSTGVNASIKYAAHSVTGSIKQAHLNFAGHHTSDQAFLEVPPESKRPESDGTLGLGPSSGSFIAQRLSPEIGAPVLERIFFQNHSTPNFFTILLGRDKDPTDFFSGSLTVGEVLDDYPDILKEPQLPITKVPESDSDDQHLQILLDADGITGPDGKLIPITSLVNQTANKKQATVVLDCGFTMPQLPRATVDAIYGRFYGSEFIQIQGIGDAWLLPCEQEVNITFRFAGKTYPIHPLDMSIDPASVNLSGLKTMNGEKACIGAFQPFIYDRGSSPNYDMVLGMAFMRNVYSLFDYGDFIKNSTTRKSPYVQLHSITDMAEAHRDFVAVRLGGVDTTATRGLRPTNTGTSSASKTIYGILVAIVVITILT